MNEIFCAARKTHIWLGADKENQAQAAFTYLENLCRRRRLRHGVVENLQTELPASTTTQCAILALLNKRFFTRRWILQEVALSGSKIIRWGNCKLEWSIFTQAILLTKYTLSHDDPGFILRHRLGPLFRLTEQRSSASMRPKLLDLMFEFRDTACSDTRDRILALLGLAEDQDLYNLNGELGNVYNYSESDVFELFAQYWSQEEAYLVLLYSSVFRNDASKHPPERCIPDWTAPARYIPYKGTIAKCRGPARIHRGRYNIITDVLSGLPFAHRGTLLWAGEACSSDPTPTEIAYLVSSWSEAVTAVLLNNGLSIPNTLHDVFETVFGAAGLVLPNVYKGRAFDTDVIETFKDQLATACASRRMCMFIDDYRFALILAPFYAQVKDEVRCKPEDHRPVLIEGPTFAFLFREGKRGLQISYEMVGDCYKLERSRTLPDLTV